MVHALSCDMTSPNHAHIPVSKCWYHCPLLGQREATNRPLTNPAEIVMSFPTSGEDSQKTFNVAQAFLAVPYLTIPPPLPFSIDPIKTMTVASIPRWVKRVQGPNTGIGGYWNILPYQAMFLSSRTWFANVLGALDHKAFRVAWTTIHSNTRLSISVLSILWPRMFWLWQFGHWKGIQRWSLVQACLKRILSSSSTNNAPF